MTEKTNGRLLFPFQNLSPLLRLASRRSVCFAPKTFRPQDVSHLAWTFRLLEIAKNGENEHLNEVENVFAVVYHLLVGKTSRQGAKRQKGEKSVVRCHGIAGRDAD